MYPDINININLPGGVAGTAQVAEDVSAIAPPPDEGSVIQTDSGYTEVAPPPDQTGGAEMSAGTAAGMPPGPEEATMGGAVAATMQTAPAPDGVYQESIADGATGFMPPGPDSAEGLAGRLSDDVSGEPPGPEASDAPQMPDAEDKEAIKKPRAKGEKKEK